MRKTCYWLIAVIMINSESLKIKTEETTENTNDGSLNETLRCQNTQNISECDDQKTIKCICDEESATHEDCCLDSDHKNNPQSTNPTFTCSSTPNDGNIYMANSCISNWTKNPVIINNCMNFNISESFNDVLLLTPVTSLTTNTTYKNLFCAMCNNVQKFEFWEILLKYEQSNNISLRPDFSSILLNLKLNKTNHHLTADINGSIYEIKLQPKLPDNLMFSIRYCLQTENDIRKYEPNISNNFSNTFRLNISEPSLPKGNHCQEIIEIDHTVASRFCSAENHGSEDYIDSCFYQTLDGKLCLINSFFVNDTEFIQINSTTVYLKYYDANFPPEEWDVQDENLIYVCGTEKPIKPEEKFYQEVNDIITEICIKFSILFLIVHIITNLVNKNWQSLPNKILFSYSVTLLALYLTFEIAQWLPSCIIASCILHYILLSSFTWLLVASYDFWLALCRTSNKCQSLVGKTRIKRYLIYSFVGWISPLFLMSIAIFFEFSPISKIPCQLKPGYGRLKQCFIAQRAPSYYFFYIPTTIIFTINISLFLHTSFHIFMSKCKRIKSTAQNNYYVLFSKLALTMGITWTQGILVTYTNVLVFRTIYCIFNASQGTFMYFAFGFDSKYFSKCIQKFVATDESNTQPTLSSQINSNNSRERNDGS